MNKKEFVERILSKVESVKLDIQIKGFQEYKDLISGKNPCYGECVTSGIIISDIAGLKGRPVTIKRHWSYNGDFTEQKFQLSARPFYKEDESHYNLSYEEGIVAASIEVSLEQLPKVKEELVSMLLEQVRLAVETRSLPGVKFAFLNGGYHGWEYRDNPIRHSEVDVYHYRADSCPIVLFGRSFGKDLSKYKATEINLPSRIGDVKITWWR